MYKGVIIEESLEDKSILREINIIEKKIEQVTEKHRTPWIKQWTLDIFEMRDEKIDPFAEKLSKALDSKHAWYADYKNEDMHYIVFKNKIFKINRRSKKQYDEARVYGLSLGIPVYQVDFHPEVIDWER